MHRKALTILLLVLPWFSMMRVGRAEPKPQSPWKQVDPLGDVHIPIGIANTVDTLKTFVEAEGNFSPGFGSYGIYFWAWDVEAGKLTAPTMENVSCERGLGGAGYLVPWSAWGVEDVRIKTEVCQVRRSSTQGEIFVVGSRARLTNTGRHDRKIALYVALRPLGPAGWPVKELTVSDAGDALLVDGHSALVADEKPAGAGVLATDTIGDLAAAGKMPAEKTAASPSGDCSGALRFDLVISPGKTKTLGFVCPVLAGRRATGHEWDGTSGWAQLDLARPNPAEGGVLQPDPGVEYYRKLTADVVFEQAHAYWKDLVGRATFRVPDLRWSECFAAIIGHAAMEMNQGAPDVAVVNYNVFNRDGVYVANILQKSGNFDLAAKAIDYFLAHPFNGRTRVEADNPGQVLWAMGEHWRFSRDRQWLGRVYPSAAKIAAMIRYYRTTPEPHYVKATSLEFGDALPPDRPDEKPAYRRQVLRPGSCDGHHPEYTEAFDVAGLRAAEMLARAADNEDDAAAWGKLAASLMESYDERFGGKLPAGYGNYCVLWPCRMYPFTAGKAFDQFRNNGATKPGGWRYFALAKAHQGLLTGNRDAGYATIDNHLNHPQMQGWYVLDEGGRSGSGGWSHVRTTWKSAVAMPHGWAIAELWLLMRDSLLLEDGDRLVLFAGVPPEWLSGKEPIVLEGLPTWFGSASISYVRKRGKAELTIGGSARPPGGFALRLPATAGIGVTVDGWPIRPSASGDFVLPPGTKRAEFSFPVGSDAAGQ